MAELCFRPSTSEFGYWFAHKLASYYQHGLDAPRTGVMVVHVFDVMISAYRDVDLRAGPELVEYTKLRDTQPVEYAVEWLYKTKTFAPWRLVGACPFGVAVLLRCCTTTSVLRRSLLVLALCRGAR